MTPPDNAKWMSELAGRAVAPPRRETLQDLIDSRDFWVSLADLDDLPAGVAVHEDVRIWTRGGSELSVEVYVPAGSGPFPLLAHFHGGGYCTGGAYNDRKAGMRFAEQGYLVVNPDYRLAPESPFPAAVEDCLYAVRWLADNAATYGGDPTRVVLEGGSAGAGLASAVILALSGLADGLDQGDLEGRQVPIAAAVLFYGLVSFPDLLLEPGSNVGAAELWNRAYLGPHFSTKLRHPLASAVFAPDHTVFPPTYLSCGSEDSMLGQTLAMVKALARAGVPTTASIVEGLDHSFVKTVDSQPAAAQELVRMHDWLAARLAATTAS